MDAITDTIIDITPTALEQILELREAEAIPDLHLGLRIAGVGAQGFLYETAFVRAEDVADGDHIEYHEGLPVAIDAESIDNLRDSVLDISTDPAAPGLVLRNPNPATPPMPDYPDLELEGTVEQRIDQLLSQQINPAIAGHGGFVRLMAVNGSTAHLEMGGGCQGCGLAAMTLRQGIESAILHHIPEIKEIVDATDHSAGEDPYY
ncbi:MAG: NifU family protein [Acidimicrobiia bacterium]